MIVLFACAFLYAFVGVELAGLFVGRPIDFGSPADGHILALISGPLFLVFALPMGRIREMRYYRRTAMVLLWFSGVLLGIFAENFANYLVHPELSREVLVRGNQLTFWNNLVIYAILFLPVTLYGHKISSKKEPGVKYRNLMHHSA